MLDESLVVGEDFSFVILVRSSVVVVNFVVNVDD